MTMVQGSTRSMVQGSLVVRGVLLAVLATVVLPPAGAWWLNTRRVAVTTDRVVAVSMDLRLVEPEGVVCGPGRMPDSDVRGAHSTHAAWVTAAVPRPEVFGPGAPTDAWGRCFLATSTWLLSAGPNGLVDTWFNAQALGGDDIGVRR